jgi:predicted DNA-binding antitoxin AbrB/MazE fold protein
MPLQPITVELSNGQKLEVLKRFYKRYQDELTDLEDKIRDIKLALAEFEFVVQYLGEQPEVAELKAKQGEMDKLEARRVHIGKLIDRLEGSIPKQKGAERPATIQRY